MPKRLSILLMLLSAVYLVALISSNIYAFPCQQAQSANVHKICASGSRQKEKPVTVSGAHSIKKCKYRTRIWTQFNLFDAPQQQNISINRYALQLKQTHGYRALIFDEVNYHSSLRGPPVFI